MKLPPKWARLLRSDDGQDVIEYTLLLCFVVLASAALLINQGGAMSGIWTTNSNVLSTAQTAATGGTAGSGGGAGNNGNNGNTNNNGNNGSNGNSQGTGNGNGNGNTGNNGKGKGN